MPFIGYAVAQQRWRMCVGLLTGMVAALLIGVAAFGVRNTSLWISTLRTPPPPHFLTYHLNGSWMSWLARVGADGAAMRAWWLTGVAVMAVLLLWRWTRSDRDVDADWLATMASSLLGSPLGWSYYAPLLLAPFVGRRSAWRRVGYGCFALPLVVVSWGQLSACPTSRNRALNFYRDRGFVPAGMVAATAIPAHQPHWPPGPTNKMRFVENTLV